MVEKTGNSGNEKKDLVEKASYLMAIISWSQPFLDGNKRTGIVSTIKFLRDNGYELEMKKEDETEIRNLLYDIQNQRTCLDQSVVKQIIIIVFDNIQLLLYPQDLIGSCLVVLCLKS